MTFKERLAIEHPENVSDKYAGGCHGCPKVAMLKEKYPDVENFNILIEEK